MQSAMIVNIMSLILFMRLQFLVFLSIMLFDILSIFSNQSFKYIPFNSSDHQYIQIGLYQCFSSTCRLAHPHDSFYLVSLTSPPYLSVNSRTTPLSRNRTLIYIFYSLFISNVRPICQNPISSNFICGYGIPSTNISNLALSNRSAFFS